MINGRSLFNSLHDRQKKTKTKNKQIKTYRLTGPPTNMEQYFDWTVVDLVLVVDIESWKLPLEANNIILISYRRLNFMCLMLTILFTIFDITWFFKIFMNQRTTNNCCNTGHFWIKGLPKLRVFQDIESKGYKQLVYSRILTNQRATKNFRIWEYWILNSKGSNFISYICIDFKNVVD